MTGRAGGVYFSVTSALLLFLSVVAFSDNLFTDVGQASNHDPKFVIHGPPLEPPVIAEPSCVLSNCLPLVPVPSTRLPKLLLRCIW